MIQKQFNFEFTTEVTLSSGIINLFIQVKNFKSSLSESICRHDYDDNELPISSTYEDYTAHIYLVQNRVFFIPSPSGLLIEIDEIIHNKIIKKGDELYREQLINIK